MIKAQRWEGLRVRERIEDRGQITCGSAWLAVKKAQFPQLTGQQKLIREDMYVIGLVNYLHVNAHGDTCGIAASVSDLRNCHVR